MSLVSLARALESLGSSAVFERALEGVEFMSIVHSRELSASFASSGVTGFSSARPGGLFVLLGSLSSLTYALGVVVLIRCRWVHSRSPCMSLRSSWDVGFAHVRRRDRCVHPGSFGSFGCALGIDGFIRCSCVNLRSPWGSLGSSRVVVFIWVCFWNRWVHPV